MSDHSPFTLVREASTQEHQPASVSPAEPPATRPRVVLPNKRKDIPQASEPGVLAPIKCDPAVQDAIARVKKAAVAAPVEMTPRPPRHERKEIPLPTPAPPTERRPGLTLLPPPRHGKASGEVALLADFDPFESNSSVAAEPAPPEDCGKIIAPALAEDQSPLTPAKIRRTKAATAILKDALATPLAITPRHVSAAKEFTAEPARLAEPLAPSTSAPVVRKAAKGALPERKVTIQNTIQADLQGWLEADGLNVKSHTPRSEEPIHEVAHNSEHAPRVSGRRLKFNCPACHHAISMPKRWIGKKIRCVQCTSAIRAPFPNQGRGTYNYENHLESLLHPDRFQVPSEGGPRILGIPIPEAHSAIIGGAAAMLVAGGTWLSHSYRTEAAAPPTISKSEPSMNLEPDAPNFKKEDPFALQEQAKQLVKSYLEANGVEAKTSFVREPDRVTPLMKDYFSRGHRDDAVVVTKLHCSTPGYYQSQDLKQRRSSVIAELADGNQASFYVEYLPSGPKIEWESSVAYSPKDWPEILREKPDKTTKPQLVRVSACLDNYFNDPQFKRTSHLCVQLQDPKTGDPLGNGYIPLLSEDGLRLRKYLYGSNKPDQVMLEVRPVANSAKERIVEITRFVKSGFRTPEPTTVASSK